MQRFKDKIVLVTGSSRGIGRATALAFAHEGADVVVNYLRRATDASSVVQEIQALGCRSFAVRADVGSRDTVKDMFQMVGEEFGGLDVLISNASIAIFEPIEKITEKHLEFTMRVNIGGPMWCIQEAEPLMTGRNGVIITNASIGAEKMFPSALLYTIAKNAVISITRYAAWDFLTRNVNISIKCVSPGFFDTDSLSWFKDNIPGFLKIHDSWVGLHGRVDTPEELAQVFVNLSLPEMRLIHGAVIPVDAGAHLLSFLNERE